MKTRRRRKEKRIRRYQHKFSTWNSNCRRRNLHELKAHAKLRWGWGHTEEDKPKKPQGKQMHVVKLTMNKGLAASYEISHCTSWETWGLNKQRLQKKLQRLEQNEVRSWGWNSSRIISVLTYFRAKQQLLEEKGNCDLFALIGEIPLFP